MEVEGRSRRGATRGQMPGHGRGLQQKNCALGGVVGTADEARRDMLEPR